MRELVYLSKRKLGAFQPEARGGGFLRRLTGIGVTAPMSMGGLNLTVAPNATSSPQLEEVMRAIENSSRGLLGVDSEGLRVGDWISFDAKLNYAVAGLPDRQGPVLFWDPDDVATEAARYGVLSYTLQAMTILVLHGSVDSLLSVEVGSHSTEHTAESMSGPGALYRAVRRLAAAPDSLGQMVEREWKYALQNLLTDLNEQYPSFMASHLAGYARVTGIIPAEDNSSVGFVLATPLFVQRDDTDDES